MANTQYVALCPYKRGALLKMEVGRGRYTYWRYLGYYAETRSYYLLPVTPGEGPPRTCLPQKWPAVHLQPRFSKDVRGTTECVQFDFMKVEIDKLPEAEAARLNVVIDLQLAPIETLVNEENFMSVVADKKKRTTLLAQAGESTGMSDAQLRERLTRYWWFGCDRNAMIPLHQRKGAPGVSRLGFGRSKTGPRPAIYEESGKEIDLGIQCSPLHKAIIQRSYKKRVLKGRNSVKRAYAAAVEKDFVTKTRKNGRIVSVSWAIHLIPSVHQYEYWGSQAINDSESRKEKAGPKTARNKMSPRRGDASDILTHSKLTLLLDGTDLPVYLVKERNTHQAIGKTKGTFAICLGSGALVGFHIGPGSESTSTYKYALLSACTSKEKIAREYGLPSTDGLVFGDWDALFIDRGPAISEAYKKSIVSQMRMERGLAESYRPEAKGTVESFFAFLKDEIRANVPGAYSRRRDELSQRAREEAKDSAVVTPPELYRCVLLAISKFNLLSDAKPYYTSEMLPFKVEMNRAAICVHLRSMRRGDAIPHWEEEALQYKLLDYTEYANNKGRIGVKSVDYFSTVLGEVWDRAPWIRVNGKLKKDCVANVAFLPGIPDQMVWMKDDGSTEMLEITRHSKKAYGGMTETVQKHTRTTYLALEQRNFRKYIRGPNMKASHEMHGSLQQSAKDRLRNGVPIAANMGFAESRREFIEQSEKEQAEKLRSRLQKSAPKPEPRPKAIAPSPEVCAPVVDLTELFDANFGE